MANFKLPIPTLSCPQCGSSAFHQGRCAACHYSTPIAIKQRRLKIAEQLRDEKSKLAHYQKVMM